MIEYKNMTDILTENKVGKYSLNKFKIAEGDFAAVIRGIPAGDYVSLKGPDNNDSGNCVLMSNTPMECRTNKEFIQKANGNVLIAGLGIGLIVLPIQEKDEVKSITIIEKSKDVIELVGKQLPLNDKVTIIEADVFKYEPDCKYDTIYLDIWSFVNSDIYNDEMVPLTEYYYDYLVDEEENPNRFIKCWAEREAEANMRLY